MIRRLRLFGRLDDLDRQSVVWLKGSHLPQDVVLADFGGDGLAIAR